MNVLVTLNGEAATLMLREAPGRVQRAVVRALNRAIGSARTVMVREVARDMSLRSGVVREQLALRKATINQPSATLAATMTRIKTIDFGARGPEPSRGRGRGVVWKGPGGVTVRDPNAFIATMDSGHRGVFKRVGISRLPILELTGASIGHVFIKYQTLGEAKAREAFAKDFDHELVFVGMEPPPPNDLTLGDDA